MDTFRTKLREAREARGWSLAQLEKESGIPKTALSRYELGHFKPRAETVFRLSEALKLSTAFFLQAPRQVDLNPIFYRSLRSTKVRFKSMAARRLTWLQQLVELIDQYVVLPNVDFPNFSVPSDPRELTSDDIETFASQTRRYWRLGDGAISDVLKLLENNGCVTARDELGCLTLDAFSQWSFSLNRPFLILADDKACGYRSRFDAAHELGHLVLHRHLDKRFVANVPAIHKLVETQAFQFAGAFLLPGETFRNSVSDVNLSTLLLLKPQWRVSVKAMIMRAARLAMISQSREKHLMVLYNRRGWTKHEALDESIPAEQPMLLSNAIQSIGKTGQSELTDFFGRLALPAHDLAALANLPSGIFEEPLQQLSPRPRLRSVTT